MKKLFTLLLLACAAIGTMMAQEVPSGAWGNLPPLHVEGRHLVDPNGNNVVLHGFMDTPSPYFNNNRWQGPGWGETFNTAHAKNAQAYFHKIFDAVTDTASGAYCNLFRLHLDPCWTNADATKAAGFTVKDGKTYDPHGNEVGGEANIYHFNKSRLKTFVKYLFFPLAKDAIDHGMYVIMRPPGVFPGYVQVGDYYNEYIKTVWDIVTQNDSIKKYAGQIMIELGNEPVTLRNSKGQEDDKALCEFFQPVVDKIRDNGFEGVVLGVGTGWQGNYRPYAKYPLIDDNLGYAVHNYVGWYGGHDDTFWTYGGNQNYKINSAQGMEAYANEFHNSVPIMDTNPIIITEIDWSPKKPGTGHTNEHGEWVESNYGSWATGSTSGWGAAYKYMLDKFDNVSWTLSGSHCFIDVDDYIKNGKVTPAYYYDMVKNGDDPAEASGVTCFEWYKQFAKERYARPDLSQPSDDPRLEIADYNIGTLMVGQNVNNHIHGTFATGMESIIPASLVSCESNERNFSEKDDALSIVCEGESNVTVSFTDPLGNTLTKDIPVQIEPIFSLSEEVFNPSIYGTGTYKTSSTLNKLTLCNGGFGGWVFDSGIDASEFNYLVVNLRQIPSNNTSVRIYNSTNPLDPYYSFTFSGTKTAKIDLKNIKDNKGNAIDPSNIRMVGFSNNGTGITYIKDLFFSPDGIANGIASTASDSRIVSEEYFNAGGVKTDALTPGINIIRQRLGNGEVKMEKIWVK